MSTDDRKPSALKEARRGTNYVFLIAIAVLVIGAVFYVGLGGGTP